MMYYVHTKTDKQGDHEVHKEGCQWLPDVNNRTYLGDYSNCKDAVSKARNLGYSPTNGCVHCCPSCHTS